MHPGLKAFDKSATACVLDGARVDGLADTLSEFDVDAESLYSGPTAEELTDVAPYLVACTPGSPFNEWLLGSLWGQSAGILILSEADTSELRTHFRRFLMVLDETGKTLYFRFYDPRVLREFLPTCDAEQLKSLFGPVQAYVVEDADPGKALRFTLQDGELTVAPIDLAVEQTSERPVIVWKGRRQTPGA